MFNKSYEERLALWPQFRATLETCEDPIQKAIDFYKDSPMVSLNADPWDQSTWPDPWELLKENEYCVFTRVLGIGYSLQLTDCLKGATFEIHIYTDDKKGYCYLLSVNNHIIGWEDDTYVDRQDLPKNLEPQHTYSLPDLQ
jgi:hypothetical protein